MSWRVIGASVAGTSHVRDQLPCQDSCRVSCHELPDGEQALVVVVADGAGSAQLGGRGAQLACELTQQSISRWLLDPTHGVPTQQLLLQWCSAAREGLQAAALQAGVMLRELACTLLVALVMPEVAAFAHIGDGGIAVERGAGLELVFWPASGEYANMTSFITDEDALEQLRTVIQLAAIQELAVFSDGIQRLALDFRALAVHAPFFNPMLAVLRQHAAQSECQELVQQLVAFLDSPKVNGRTDDDKTLVLATRRLAALDILPAGG